MNVQSKSCPCSLLSSTRRVFPSAPTSARWSSAGCWTTCTRWGGRCKTSVPCSARWTRGSSGWELHWGSNCTPAVRLGGNRLCTEWKSVSHQAALTEVCLQPWCFAAFTQERHCVYFLNVWNTVFMSLSAWQEAATEESTARTSQTPAAPCSSTSTPWSGILSSASQRASCSLLQNATICSCF